MNIVGSRAKLSIVTHAIVSILCKGPMINLRALCEKLFKLNN